MNPCTISCNLHDYIEIACMYAYQVRLVLAGQQIIDGKALDVTSIEKKEYLVLDVQGQERLVDLTNIAKMQALTPHAKFTEVDF